jgi:hypothetical protein
MDVIVKNYPKKSITDNIYPVIIWKERPEIVKIAIYDHVKRHNLSIEGARELDTQILYENNDFVWEKGSDFRINKLYRGIAVFNRHGNLKTLETAGHICHIV